MSRHTDRDAVGDAALLALMLGLAAHACTFKSEIRGDPPGVLDPDVVTPPPYITTITPTGTSPQVLHVWQGRMATFVNNDTRPHTIHADPHSEHYRCGGVLNLGVLKPGERRDVENLPLNACFYHDEGDPANRPFAGAVVVH